MLVPSWKFFEELGEVSRLYYRFGTDRSTLGSWILYEKKPFRNLGHLFINAEENLYLANIRLIADLPETSAMVEKLVQWEIHKTHPDPFYFQFKAGDFTSETFQS